MASKQLRARSSSRNKRREKKNGHSIISSDVMGNRNVEIVPVGAWVEPADADGQPNAVLLAQMEDEKIKYLQMQKINRLRTFQRDVKQRLSKINRLKREQQIHDAEKAFEQERKVVQQSFLTGDTSTRVNTCTQRQDLNRAIMKRLLEKYGEDVSTWDRPAGFSQREESHNATDKARQQLVSKKVEPRKVVITNPEEQGVLVVRHIQNPTVKSVTHMAPTHKSMVIAVNTESVTRIAPAHKSLVSGMNSDSPDTTSDGDEENRTQSEDDNYCNNIESKEEEYEEELSDKGEELQISNSEYKAIKEILKKNKAGKSRRPTSARLAAILKNETKHEILERQKKQQAAISRRIFMDRERQAVRENLRREIQRKKIISLKKEKEEYRQELEEMAQRELDPICPVLDEMEEERKLREEFEELQMREIVMKRKEEIKRSREMERYLDALRHQLLEKVKRHNIQLPALCPCGDTLWDTHPETCANNCFFYKNQRAYARALQSLISSVEVN